MVRHDVALHEVTFAAVPQASITVAADAWNLRLLLLDIASAVIDACAPGASLAMHVAATANGAQLRIDAATPLAAPMIEAIEAVAAFALFAAPAAEDHAGVALDLAAAFVRAGELHGQLRVWHDATGIHAALELPHA
jgi:hypothetical protein